MTADEARQHQADEAFGREVEKMLLLSINAANVASGLYKFSRIALACHRQRGQEPLFKIFVSSLENVIQELDLSVKNAQSFLEAVKAK